MRILPIATLMCLLSAPAFSQSHDDQLHSLEHFFESATIVSGPKVVDCTLSGGTQTECFSITVKAEPSSYTPGPWCPSSITDDADEGGIWLQDGKVNDVDGNFVANLDTFYDDDEWQLFDPETGAVRVTNTKISCEAAARPDVDPEYNNYCVQCLPEYMAEDATMTYTIPLEPHDTNELGRTNFSGSGVAHNGVRLDGAAPVADILAAHTIAPFDDCGGHVNTHVGYHYHAVTGCLEGNGTQVDDATQIGIAMDGYPILTHLLSDGSEPKDLDSCGGHVSAELGYHYHAGEAGSNAILSCLRAEVGCASEDPDAICDASARRPRP